jgi:enoyl-CoA hydratase/carnithine racemase
MSEHVVVTCEAGDVLLVRLARPEKKNALTGAMYDALREALEGADREDSGVGAVVIAGSAGVFTAGNDLHDFAADAAGGRAEASPALRFIRRLVHGRTPLVAAVDGIAVGIGTTMTLHCDLVYVTPEARFRMPFVDLGLVPEAGSSLILPRRVGWAKATELLLLGEPFSGEEAVRLGLANAVVPADTLLDHALAQAARLAAKPRAALATARSLMRGDTAALAAVVEAESDAFAKALASPEAKAAFQAFLARPPRA